MKIVSLLAQNIKRLRAVSITPNGNMVQITGENGAGKTSALDAILYALGGTSAIASQPIRRGETEASVQLDLGTIIVRREFVEGEDGAATTRLFVESPEGARYPSPQKFLDAMLGELTFDPLEFTRLEPKKQLETLRRLVTLDVDVDALDRQNARDYEARRDWNRKVASLKDRVATLAEGVDPTMDVELVDVSALTQRMVEASDHNAAIDRTQADRDARDREAADLNRRAGEQFERARELRRQADQAQARGDEIARKAIELLNAAEGDAELPQHIVVSTLREEMNAALRTNQVREQQQRQREMHRSALHELNVAEIASDNLTSAMEDRAAAKAAAIARAAMPVEGLGFGDGQVTYNGLPFDQASGAEQLRVSFAIAMAANPKLRIALIRDGSLLSAKSLALVAEMAEAHDFQVWIEKAEVGGKVGILLDDGAVVAIDGVPVEHEMVAAD